jgi:methionine-rich copper-binding protein CopC
MNTTKHGYLRRENGLTAVLWALLILLSSITLAAAHETTVTSSDPADGAIVAESPDQVSATFSEELDTKGSTMIVVDATGKQVSEGNGKVDLNDPDHATMIATLPASVGDGAYTVQWHAVLTDGDASEGTFRFSIQAGASQPEGGATVTPATEAISPAVVQPEVATPASPPTGQQRTGLPAGWLLAGLGVVLAVAVLFIVLRRVR